jgi:hypothetical protein
MPKLWKAEGPAISAGPSCFLSCFKDISGVKGFGVGMRFVAAGAEEASRTESVTAAGKAALRTEL